MCVCVCVCVCASVTTSTATQYFFSTNLLSHLSLPSTSQLISLSPLTHSPVCQNPSVSASCVHTHTPLASEERPPSTLVSSAGEWHSDHSLIASTKSVRPVLGICRQPNVYSKHLRIILYTHTHTHRHTYIHTYTITHTHTPEVSICSADTPEPAHSHTHTHLRCQSAL